LLSYVSEKGKKEEKGLRGGKRKKGVVSVLMPAREKGKRKKTEVTKLLKPSV